MTQAFCPAWESVSDIQSLKETLHRERRRPSTATKRMHSYISHDLELAQHFRHESHLGRPVLKRIQPSSLNLLLRKTLDRLRLRSVSEVGGLGTASFRLAMSQLLQATSLTACSTAFKQDSRSCQSKRFSFRSSLRLHKPFVGDRRQAPQPRAVCRTPTVCITKVGEAEFQSEVLKVTQPPSFDKLSLQPSLYLCRPWLT